MESRASLPSPTHRPPSPRDPHARARARAREYGLEFVGDADLYDDDDISSGDSIVGEVWDPWATIFGPMLERMRERRRRRRAWRARVWRAITRRH